MFNKHTDSMLNLASLEMYSKRNQVFIFVKFESVTRIIWENINTRIEMKSDPWQCGEHFDRLRAFKND